MPVGAWVLLGSVSTQRHFIMNVFDASPWAKWAETRERRKLSQMTKCAANRREQIGAHLCGFVKERLRLVSGGLQNCNKRDNRVVRYFKQGRGKRQREYHFPLLDDRLEVSADSRTFSSATKIRQGGCGKTRVTTREN